MLCACMHMCMCVCMQKYACMHTYIYQFIGGARQEALRMIKTVALSHKQMSYDYTTLVQSVLEYRKA
jgi:hypothetical protein